MPFTNKVKAWVHDAICGKVKNTMKAESNIILIGMPAAGKSTVGLLLADTLAFDYFDTDTLIENHEGLSLSGIIARDGLVAFRALEEKLVSHINVRHTIIATGGSVVYGQTAMAHLKRIGTLVYIHTDLDVLVKRMNDPTERGVVRKPGQTFESLFEERHRLYMTYADIVVNCAPDDIPEITAARIIEKLPG